MRDFPWTAVALLGVCTVLAGCSSPADRYRAELKNAMRALNDLHYTLAKDKEAQGKQQGTTTGPKISSAEIADITQRLENIKLRLDELEPQNERVREKILEQYSPALEAIGINIGNFRTSLSASSQEDKATLEKAVNAVKALDPLLRSKKKSDKDKKGKS